MGTEIYVIDPKRVEVPNENLFLAKLRGECRRFIAFMLREHEVRRRRYHFESQRRQFCRQPLAARDDLAAAFAEPRVVLIGGGGGGLREAVEWIRVEAVLHAIERVDQRGVAECETDAHARERARLRYGLHDQQIRIPADQSDRGL